MREICDDVIQNVPEVLKLWEQISSEEPWMRLPPEHRLDDLPDLVIGLMEASLCDPLEIDSHHAKVQAAARHGEARREQGFSQEQIFTEYHFLRQAIWKYIRGRFGDQGRAAAAIIHIDTAITLATSASLLGFNADEVRRSGKYEERLDRMAHSSPLLRRP